MEFYQALPVFTISIPFNLGSNKLHIKYIINLISIYAKSSRFICLICNIIYYRNYVTCAMPIYNDTNSVQKVLNLHHDFF